jgi:hypothetical protein
LRTRTTLRRRSARCSSSAAVAARAIAENNMNNARTTSRRSRANRRAHQFRSRGRVRPRSGDWKIPVSVPVTMKGVTVTVPVSIGNRYVVTMTVCDPTWWSDAEYNYVSQIYKFNIYSEDYISIFGFETNFNDTFKQLVAWTGVVLKGRCRKE